MEEYIALIYKVNDILNAAESINDESERTEYFIKNINVFNEFKDSLHVVLRVFLFKEKDDVEQNEIAEKVKNNLIRLLDMKNVFERDDTYPYFKYELLQSLSWYENKFAYSLQYEKDMSKVESAIQYLQDRKDYIDILRANNLFEGQDLNDTAAKGYVSDEYEQNMLGHALIIIKNNLVSLTKDDVVRLTECIDNSMFFKELILKDNNQMNFYEKNLIYQYCETILKMKSIFTPDKLKDDEFVKQFWEGKIEDPKVLSNILGNISVYSIINMLENDQYRTGNGLIMDLSNHFESVNLSNENIAQIMKKVFDSQSDTFEYARFLAQIDLPDDYNEFRDSQYANKFQWLTNSSVFESLKDCEKSIEEARMPFLPAEYYIKKLDKLEQGLVVNEHFVGNLVTLIHSDYYSEDEKNELIEALKRNGLYNDKYDIDRQLTFDETDTPEITQEKVKQAYNSGQVIPTEVAKKLLNDDLSEQFAIDKETLQACVQAIICNTLQNLGIDIQNKVFFGDGHGKTLGYNDSINKAIWIDDYQLEKYLNANDWEDKTKIFNTMFHEMQHSIQYYNMENDHIDYLTYNFIKEEVIEHYDPEFYDENYEAIYMESDARKQGILGTLSFLKGLNPDFVRAIKEPAQDMYINERVNHPLYKDSLKKISIGKNNKIDVSEYVGILIQNNPNILLENPILEIEYNRDGTQKDVETLLNEFEQKKREDSSNYKNLYSIYYGLVMREKESVLPENADLQQRIDVFMQEAQDLITMEDMQERYKPVPSDTKSLRKAYFSFLDIVKGISESKKRGPDDKTEE